MKSAIVSSVLIVFFLAICNFAFAQEIRHGGHLSCALVLCAPGMKCIETPTGPQCVANSCFCSKIFKPVCCLLLNGVRETRSNECLCSRCPFPKLRGFPISSGSCHITPTPSCKTVKCSRGFVCKETPEGPKCVRSKPGPCICTLQYDPVCCKSPSGTITKKSNSCFCTGCNSGATIVSDHACGLSAHF